MAVRRLSSSLTGFYKLVFGPLWIGGVLLATLLLAIGAPSNPEARRLLPMFAGALIVGGLFLGATIMRIQKVDLDEDHLLVSNFFRVTKVPLACVTKVSESIRLSPELIVLKVEGCPEVGKTVVFMPPIRLFGGWSVHPMVAELRERVDASGPSSRPRVF